MRRWQRHHACLESRKPRKGLDSIPTASARWKMISWRHERRLLTEWSPQGNGVRLARLPLPGRQTSLCRDCLRHLAKQIVLISHESTRGLLQGVAKWLSCPAWNRENAGSTPAALTIVCLLVGHPLTLLRVKPQGAAPTCQAGSGGFDSRRSLPSGRDPLAGEQPHVMSPPGTGCRSMRSPEVKKHRGVARLAQEDRDRDCLHSTKVAQRFRKPQARVRFPMEARRCFVGVAGSTLAL